MHGTDQVTVWSKVDPDRLKWRSNLYRKEREARGGGMTSRGPNVLSFFF